MTDFNNIIESGLKAEQIEVLKNNNNIQIINAEKMLINDNIERKSIISILRLRLKDIIFLFFKL